MGLLLLPHVRGTVARVAIAVCAMLAFAFALVPRAGSAAVPDSAFPPPVVVVYPFTVSGDASPTSQTGGNIALLLANRLGELGGIAVKPFVPGTVRSDYLTAAQKQSADYYVTGFLTPIGSEVSLITQVVSTYGGTVVWSSTVTVRTYGDAIGQADPLRRAILAHAERSLSSLSAQAPPAATPQPETRDAAGVNLTRALGRKHRGDSSPSPSPSPAPAGSSAPLAAAPAAVPVTGALVASVAGSGDPALRAYAAAALAKALRRDGAARGGVVAIDAKDAIAHAADLCKANGGVQAIYVATLDTAAAPASATLGVSAYDCAGKALGVHADTEELGRRDTSRSAVDRAAAKTVDAFLKSAKG